MSYQYLTHFTSNNSTPRASVAAVFGLARDIKGFTYHHWGDPAANPTFEGIVSWLTRPNGNTSAHYVAEGKPQRRVACIVAPYDAAWHTGTALGNATTIGIELNPQATDEDYDVAAELSADLISAFGDQLKYGHRDWTPTACPGRYDINKIDRLSYTKYSASEWGQGGNIKPATPAPVSPPAPAPAPTVTREWVQNLKDITDTKLTVLAAEGVRRTNLITGQLVDDVIPRGTQIDIAKETSVGGRKYYISSYSANANAAIGLDAAALGVPATPPSQEKPAWLKNLEDIADQDMWTRSETPVLRLGDGATVDRLPTNTKVRITHATRIVDINLLVLEGQTTGVETVYLSDKPIINPEADLLRENNALLKTALQLITEIATKLKNIFR